MEYLERSELRNLFEVAYEHDRTHHLFLLTTLWHALRVSEAINIHGMDIQCGELTVPRIKKGHPTRQPIHRDGDILFDETPVIAVAAENPNRLFNFSRQWADLFIKKYCVLAGIHSDKAHMHALRHSFAMLLWDKTHSLGMIQGYLGHRCPSSTLIYLVEVDRCKAHAAAADITI